MKNNCIQCGSETMNPKFCSSSCSATYNNKVPKRKLKVLSCKHCGTELKRESWKDSRRTVCDSCNPSNVDWESVTYADIRGVRAYQKNSRIRGLARKTFLLHNISPICFNCGYSKHIEVCHIKPISSFHSNTKVSEINDIHNLVGLCPNCHWEFDNGILHLDFPEFNSLHQ